MVLYKGGNGIGARGDELYELEFFEYGHISFLL